MREAPAAEGRVVPAGRLVENGGGCISAVDREVHSKAHCAAVSLGRPTPLASFFEIPLFRSPYGNLPLRSGGRGRRRRADAIAI